MFLESSLLLGVPNQYQRKEVTAQFSDGLLRDETAGSSVVFVILIESSLLSGCV